MYALSSCIAPVGVLLLDGVERLMSGAVLSYALPAGTLLLAFLVSRHE